MDKKGFTLIELLAVVVVLAILILLAVPEVQKSINLSRRKSFVKDARTIVSVAKKDAISVNANPDYTYNGFMYLYRKESINKSLDRKLDKSPFGAQYSDAGVLIKKDDDGKYVNYVCLVDKNGNGFDYTKTSELTANSVIQNSTIKCNKEFDTFKVEIAVQNGLPLSDSTTVISDEIAEFHVVPNRGFDKTPPDIICDNGQMATFSNNTVTTSKITNDTKCLVNFRANSSKPDCPAPKSVNISQEGVVTWISDNGTNGYEISTDGVTWTTATSGMNYLNQIVSGSGVIYLRSLCDAAQYNTPSTISPEQIDVHTVNVVVENGEVNIASKKVISGGQASFTISSSNIECTNAPTVSCTNNQVASINGSSLDVGPVSNDTTCTVKYPLKTYLVKYEKGSYSDATGLPDTQTKYCGKSLVLSNTSPNGNTNNTFLGWATKSSATDTSGTWYDGGTAYNTNANLTLYAQWYDVTSLEKAYTKYVQYNDFKQKTTVTNNISYNGGDGYTISTAVPSLDGYTYKFLSGFNLYYTQRPYKMTSSSTVYRSMANASSVSNTKYYFMIKDRDATSYTGEVDSRIDRLQKLYDVTLARSEIIPFTYEADSVTLSSSNRAVTKSFSPREGYKFVGTAGHSIKAASSNSLNASIVYCYKAYATADTANMGVAISYDANARFRIYLRTMQVKQKSKRTTTFSPTSNKGLTRYKALVSLDDAKSKRFVASHIKTTNFTSSLFTGSGWSSPLIYDKNISIPSGKIFGLVSYRARNGTNGSGESFANFNDAAVKWVDDTHGTIYIEARPGNSILSDSSAHSFTNVKVDGSVLYLSKDTLSS